MTEPIRVLIVDDHPVVREGLRALLTVERDMVVVGEAGSAEDALTSVGQLAPDVVVLDIKLKDDDGIEVCREIKERRPETAVIMLSAFWDDFLTRRALQAGADGYLLKHAERFDLQKSIRAVARGEPVLDPALVGPVFGQLRQQRALDKERALTRRDLALLRLVAQGLTNKEIAGHLHLSPHTVKEYLSVIMAKLGAKNRVHAVLLAKDRTDF